RVADDLYFGLELDTGICGDTSTHMRNQRFDVSGARRAVVDDEVGVHGRDFAAADAIAFEAASIDQPPGEITRRILEHRTTTRFARRLRRAPLGQHRPDAGRALAGCAVRQRKPRTEEPCLRAIDRAIARLEFMCRAAPDTARTIDRLY